MLRKNENVLKFKKKYNLANVKKNENVLQIRKI